MKDGCESQKNEKNRVPSNCRFYKIPPPRKTLSANPAQAFGGAGALIVLTLLMVAHFVQWRIMGQTISPIEPSESMQTLQRGAINAGFIFFTLAILATLVFGRFVCGWGCHILALQDFLRVAFEEIRTHTEAVFGRGFWSLCRSSPRSICSFCRPFYRLFAVPKKRAADSAIYQSFNYEQFLGNFSAARGRYSVSFHLRIYDRLFFSDRRVSALMPVLTADFLISLTSFRPEKFA